MIKNTIKWPLVSGTHLHQWTTGRLVVLGDAAHAMLPYMSQGKVALALVTKVVIKEYSDRQFTGAAMAVEDGVALTRSLAKITTQAEIGYALRIFENVRMDRATKMQEASLLNGKLWHFADGPLQQARDAAMVPETQGEPFSHSPNQWSDPATQMWCYSYDAAEAIDRAWTKHMPPRSSL